MVRPDFKMMGKDEIVRRLVRMIGDPYVKRPTEITRRDVAKWFGVELRLVRQHCADVQTINDFWQVAYSQFFELMDAGAIRVDFDNRGRKTLTRIAPPAAAPKKKLRPFVDIGTMRLGFDT